MWCRSVLRVISADAEILNRRTNRWRNYADRVFAATFDPCVHVATNTA